MYKIQPLTSRRQDRLTFKHPAFELRPPTSLVHGLSPENRFLFDDQDFLSRKCQPCEIKNEPIRFTFFVDAVGSMVFIPEPCWVKVGFLEQRFLSRSHDRDKNGVIAVKKLIHLPG